MFFSFEALGLTGTHALENMWSGEQLGAVSEKDCMRVSDHMTQSFIG